MLERVLTMKRESVRIQNILLRENVSSEELNRRIEELWKSERADSKGRNQTFQCFSNKDVEERPPGSKQHLRTPR
jgi:hypothetical protein